MQMSLLGKKEDRYSNDELQARLKFFIGSILGLTLFGIVFVVLYSLIFVTQPMNGMSPVDNKFFELIIPIATFLTGTLSGIMLAGSTKEEQEAMQAMHKIAQDNAKEAAKTSKETFEVLARNFTPPAAVAFGPRQDPQRDNNGRKLVPLEQEEEK
jgi:hypothetical protein